ncbi:MAG: enoyl-CoA hydratase/isomerase family protein [Sulfobacillus acidophilus]|uniref:Enoyl-CoA hydratase/isomerase family protein n=1 Tax=Sulfobacillus acidophilus TaxID=53633 RepID=A0A2T2WKY5_9FIRM|nr:MAG: enoyl-CoA hydratase/isomerase family protein [Sulfobacillus acidophilus]
MLVVDSHAVVWAQQDACAILTLNRPDSLNSLTAEVRRELLEGLNRANQDPLIRVVAIRAVGRTFCVGQDLKELQHFYAENGYRIGALVNREYIPIVRALRHLSKPTVAIVEGAAIGGGMALALACDFRIVSAKARLVPAFVNVGLAPDTGTTFLLARSIGYARALSLCLLGQPLPADDLVRMGLAESVAHGAEEVQAQFDQLLQQLVHGPTRAYAEIRRLFDESSHLSFEAVLRQEAEVQDQLSQTQDHRVAIEAFLAKQTPEFSGH